MWILRNLFREASGFRGRTENFGFIVAMKNFKNFALLAKLLDMRADFVSNQEFHLLDRKGISIMVIGCALDLRKTVPLGFRT